MNTFIAASLCAISLGAVEPAPAALERCDVVLEGPSSGANGALPVGNGSLGASVWIEPQGDVVVLINHTDTFSEASRLLKIGRIRLRAEPAFTVADCRATLRLRQGRVVLELGTSRLEVFAEPDAPRLRISGTLVPTARLRVVDDGWRYTHAPDGEEMAASWTMDGAPAGIAVAESSDVRLTARQAAQAIGWYHRNETTAVPATLAHQGCAGLPGAFDPVLHRTFGAWIEGPGLARADDGSLAAQAPVSAVDLRISCPVLQAPSAAAWIDEARRLAAAAPAIAPAAQAHADHWSAFWDRSWIFVAGEGGSPPPSGLHPLRFGVDSQGANRFAGVFGRVVVHGRRLGGDEIAALAAAPPEGPAPALADRLIDVIPQPGSQRDGLAAATVQNGLSIAAWIRPERAVEARIVDSMTAGGSDGFIFDTWPGDALRLIVGGRSLHAKGVLKTGVWQHVAATYNADGGGIALWLDGRRIAGAERPRVTVSQAYQLHRYMTACQNRGEFPPKFNGGMFTVEPVFENPALQRSPDWRRWGDCYWWQNTRLMYHPMLAAGDLDLLDPLWRFYARQRPLAEARSQAWYGSAGSWIPETVTLFGTYANKDYGWDRRGKAPGEVASAWWRWNWVQTPELIDLLLRRWEWSRDEDFVRRELLPQAESLLRYIDTRFRRDDRGRLWIDPAQSAETYWHGVVNDLPTVAGLRCVLPRLVALPAHLTSPAQRDLFTRLLRICPPIPVGERETKQGRQRVLLPAERFEDRTNNCENPETYAIWPFPHYGVGKPDLEMAITTFRVRKFNLPSGWGYDGQLAAALGLAEEAGRDLVGKAQNSHPAYRFPATWGPNFDWLPDNCHGGNLMTVTQMMLMQCEGDTIRLLPAWPAGWDVDARLHAPGRTVIRLVVRAGKIERLEVEPAARRADVVIGTRR